MTNPENNEGVVSLSGIKAEDETLFIEVSDSDGFSSDISYLLWIQNRLHRVWN